MRPNPFSINRFTFSLVAAVILSALLAGCRTGVARVAPQALPLEATQPATPIPPAPQATTPRPTSTPTRASTPLPSATPAFRPVGPTEFPPGFNPLTGLEVADPSLLDLPPALVSISNSPITARPQTGLSYASVVFEMYIGVGVSRFLALFYGDYPPEQAPDGSGPVMLGPIRSGRLPYEKLRQLYKGFLVFASASDRVLQHLDEYHIIYGKTGAGDVNSARVSVSDLKNLAGDFRKELGTPRLYGLRFDAAPPEGGKGATRLWIPFHTTDQVIWRYNPVSGAYQRSQDQADGVTFVPSTDALGNRPLEFENVVVLFAAYHYYDATYFNIDLHYITRSPALLFRDGKMYEIFWTTGNETYERATGFFRPIRLVNRAGEAIPLRPGQTWVEIVPLHTAYAETVDSENYRELMTKQMPGSGSWAVYFNPPELEGSPTPVPVTEEE